MIPHDTRPVCPRCLGHIPNNDSPGSYPGARSRRSRGPGEPFIEVCSECGKEEAFIKFTQSEAALLAEEWPIHSERAVGDSGGGLHG